MASIFLGQGQIVTPPQAYSPTYSNLSGISSSTVFWYRNGLWLHIDGQIAFGSAGTSAALTVALPTAIAGNPVIDTTLLPGGTNTSNPLASALGNGDSFWFQAGVAWKGLWPKYATTTTFGFWNATQAFFNDQGSSGSALNFRVKVPIVGW